MPYHSSVPCGQCTSCRVNAQRAWSARILLEAMSWPHSLFVTLTYSDDHVPVLADGQLTLYPDDLTKFWKRLRKRLGASRLRYFGCGEYGEESWRPHYHAVLFGLSALDCRKVGKHMVHPDVQAAWGHGYTSAGELTPQRAAYVAQYVTKKLTRFDDERVQKKLKGRWPEFARASRRPGIGCGLDGQALSAMAEALAQAAPEAEDVPFEVVMPDGRRFGMPQFLAAKLREELGMERLARDRPPREREPPSGEYVEFVSVGVAGAMTRRVPVEEQKAREAEAKAARRFRRRRERLTSGKEEEEAFRERGGDRERRGKGESAADGAAQKETSGRRVPGPPGAEAGQAGQVPGRLESVGKKGCKVRIPWDGSPKPSAPPRPRGPEKKRHNQGNGGRRRPSHWQTHASASARDDS